MFCSVDGGKVNVRQLSRRGLTDTPEQESDSTPAKIGHAVNFVCEGELLQQAASTVATDGGDVGKHLVLQRPERIGITMGRKFHPIF